MYEFRILIWQFYVSPIRDAYAKIVHTLCCNVLFKRELAGMMQTCCCELLINAKIH